MSSSSANTASTHTELGLAETGYDGCCEGCKKDSSELVFCNVCESTLCSDCWSEQVPHKKERQAPNAIPHEKTDPWIAKQVQNVFSPLRDDLARERMYLEDEDTSWFGSFIPSSTSLI
jgi:hypothetical protein